MRFAMWLAAATLAWPLSASAEKYDGNWLHDLCRDVGSGRSTYASGTCNGYILGTGHLWSRLQQSPRFCIDGNVQVGQIQDIVIKFLNENPQRRHQGAADLILSAIVIAFPCPSSSSQ